MRTLEIVHRTRYEYAEPVTLNDYRLMFRPRDSHDLRLLHTSLVIEPAAAVRWIHDPFGNSIAIASFASEPVPALELVSTIRVEHFGVLPEDAGARSRRSRSTRASCRSATLPRRRPTSRAMSSATIPIPTRW